MFRQLMNFSYQRTALQAVGWYLIYLLMGILIGATAGTILSMGIASFGQSGQPSLGYVTGQIIVIPYPIALAFALVRSRLTRLNIVLAVLAPLLSAFAGILLWAFAGLLSSLIPLAVLTTRPVQKSPAEIGEIFK